MSYCYVSFWCPRLCSGGWVPKLHVCTQCGVFVNSLLEVVALEDIKCYQKNPLSFILCKKQGLELWPFIVTEQLMKEDLITRKEAIASGWCRKPRKLCGLPSLPMHISLCCSPKMRRKGNKRFHEKKPLAVTADKGSAQSSCEHPGCTAQRGSFGFPSAFPRIIISVHPISAKRGSLAPICQWVRVLCYLWGSESSSFIQTHRAPIPAVPAGSISGLIAGYRIITVHAAAWPGMRTGAVFNRADPPVKDAQHFCREIRQLCN